MLIIILLSAAVGAASSVLRLRPRSHAASVDTGQKHSSQVPQQTAFRCWN